MKFILNIVWLVLGGFHAATAWFLASLLMLITVICFPWARAAFNVGVLLLWPFGAQVVSRDKVDGPDLGTGSLGTMGNIVWFCLAGWWLFLTHLFYVFVCGITIIGIPFALQHWKIAKLCLAPVGKTIVWQ